MSTHLNITYIHIDTIIFFSLFSLLQLLLRFKENNINAHFSIQLLLKFNILIIYQNHVTVSIYDMASHPELNILLGSLYNYINQGVLLTRNIDLTHKVKFKPRKIHQTQITNWQYLPAEPDVEAAETLTN